MRIRAIVPMAAMAALVLSGCGGKTEVDDGPSSRPVKLYTVEGAGGAAIRDFPGSVRASQRADLAFRVPGVLQQMLVREGEEVKEGQLLAALDPTDFKITLEDRQATFDNAERNFSRAKELIVDGNISKLDYDRMEANFKTAQAELSQARQDLEYTELKAPFDGVIGQRDVENFEEVLAKQTIFRFQNTDTLDIMIDLPESLVRSLTPPGETPSADSDEAKAIDATARFEGRSDTRFPLDIKEVATKADEQTQTFRVTMSMASPGEFRVLPGMTATVQVDFSEIMDVGGSKWVPINAVQANGELDAQVWVLDPDAMTVSSKQVKIGALSGRNIEITSGLMGGEEIVSVGAPYLADGMRVTRMKKSEQAVPREDEQF